MRFSLTLTHFSRHSVDGWEFRVSDCLLRPFQFDNLELIKTFGWLLFGSLPLLAFHFDLFL